jgi:hypothetical protein
LAATVKEQEGAWPASVTLGFVEAGSRVAHETALEAVRRALREMVDWRG